jgi:hypothetical protein
MNLTSAISTTGLSVNAQSTRASSNWKERIGFVTRTVGLTSVTVAYECTASLVANGHTFTLTPGNGSGVINGEGSTAEGADGFDFEGINIPSALWPVYGLCISCDSGSFTIEQSGTFDSLVLNAGASILLTAPLGNTAAASSSIIITATADNTALTLTILGGVD